MNSGAVYEKRIIAQRTDPAWEETESGCKMRLTEPIYFCSDAEDPAFLKKRNHGFRQFGHEHDKERRVQSVQMGE